MNTARLPEAFIDVHHRADEVHADLIGGTNTKDVSPELLTFLDGPRRSALVNRDDELGDGAQDLEELGFCGFHVYVCPDCEPKKKLPLKDRSNSRERLIMP